MQARFCDHAQVTTNNDDAASAFANLRLEDVVALPIPAVDFNNKKPKAIHDAIITDVDAMMAGAKVGSREDRRIGQNVGALWGLKPDDGVLIGNALEDAPRTGPVAQMLISRQWGRFAVLRCDRRFQKLQHDRHPGRRLNSWPRDREAAHPRYGRQEPDRCSSCATA